MSSYDREDLTPTPQLRSLHPLIRSQDKLSVLTEKEPLAPSRPLSPAGSAQSAQLYDSPASLLTSLTNWTQPRLAQTNGFAQSVLKRSKSRTEAMPQPSQKEPPVLNAVNSMTAPESPTGLSRPLRSPRRPASVSTLSSNASPRGATAHLPHLSAPDAKDALDSTVVQSRADNTAGNDVFARESQEARSRSPRLILPDSPGRSQSSASSITSAAEMTMPLPPSRSYDLHSTSADATRPRRSTASSTSSAYNAGLSSRNSPRQSRESSEILPALQIANMSLSGRQSDYLVDAPRRQSTGRTADYAGSAANRVRAGSSTSSPRPSTETILNAPSPYKRRSALPDAFISGTSSPRRSRDYSLPPHMTPVQSSNGARFDSTRSRTDSLDATPYVPLTGAALARRDADAIANAPDQQVTVSANLLNQLVARVDTIERQSVAGSIAGGDTRARFSPRSTLARRPENGRLREDDTMSSFTSISRRQPYESPRSENRSRQTPLSRARSSLGRQSPATLRARQLLDQTLRQFKAHFTDQRLSEAPETVALLAKVEDLLGGFERLQQAITYNADLAREVILDDSDGAGLDRAIQQSLRQSEEQLRSFSELLLILIRADAERGSHYSSLNAGGPLPQANSPINTRTRSRVGDLATSPSASYATPSRADLRAPHGGMSSLQRQTDNAVPSSQAPESLAEAIAARYTGRKLGSVHSLALPTVSGRQRTYGADTFSDSGEEFFASLSGTPLDARSSSSIMTRQSSQGSYRSAGIWQSLQKIDRSVCRSMVLRLFCVGHILSSVWALPARAANDNQLGDVALHRGKIWPPLGYEAASTYMFTAYCDTGRASFSVNAMQLQPVQLFATVRYNEARRETEVPQVNRTSCDDKASIDSHCIAKLLVTATKVPLSSSDIDLDCCRFVLSATVNYGFTSPTGDPVTLPGPVIATVYWCIGLAQPNEHESDHAQQLSFLANRRREACCRLRQQSQASTVGDQVPTVSK
ncbi:uncharacterized protein L969DRAFT_93867 [Mixia osmundae IAM 14324]|uniref:Uncharacterized protein n=1 Tax=Mixia osmundae (strain CBS 9802 / IAM 14324 / JCM 22182 / KY 12970) TaxID=764103 RepID=G7E9T6_MIXOS|nr:uncharacterized protein L969DRAFT_93867 [Mixia osmundae IAM 14324]KEI40038.1 hypothetical protein L969DRAFT_93867 [Mixia osmundae IAM 14324]GAA99405.1 hypothetical protein E5Q_06103 [Mixia osmundae IAM 14324]